jgi:hypothetical protein
LTVAGTFSAGRFGYYLIMVRTIIALSLVAGFAYAEDSPLVALAKRTNASRKPSKRMVITNETLTGSRTQLTTAGGQQTTPATTTDPLVAWLNSPSALPAAVRTPSEAAPESLPATDSAYPATTARTIEPSITAVTIVPESTIRTIEPSSGAQSIEPESTARSIPTESTANTIEPQVAKPPQ